MRFVPLRGALRGHRGSAQTTRPLTWSVPIEQRPTLEMSEQDPRGHGGCVREARRILHPGHVAPQKRQAERAPWAVDLDEAIERGQLVQGWVNRLPTPANTMPRVRTEVALRYPDEDVTLLGCTEVDEKGAARSHPQACRRVRQKARRQNLKNRQEESRKVKQFQPVGAREFDGAPLE